MANERIEPPENIKVTPQGSQLEIVWKWSDQNPVALAVAVGALGWFIFGHLSAGELSIPDLLRIYFSGVMQNLSIGSVVVPVLVLAACSLVYSVIAKIVNRTGISVGSERIVIRHGPLPWLGNKTVDTKGIKQVFIKHNPGRNRRNSTSLMYFFDVLAVADNGDPVKLLSGLHLYRDQATYIAQEIESRLGLRTASPGRPLRTSEPSIPHGARPDRSDEPPARGTPPGKNSGVARVMASLLGTLAIIGGVYLIVPVVELHEAGANYMSQFIRVLFGTWPLVVGVLFLGGATRLLNDRVTMFLYGASFMIPVIAFLLLAIYGMDGGTGTVYVTKQNIEAERAKRALAGKQVTAVAPGRVFKDCDDCPDMVEIPPGTLVMGSDLRHGEQPAHRVTFARPFALAKTEITQAQWRVVMGSNPSYFSRCGDNCPVERVSWQDAHRFVRKLSEKTGQTYRLPSESEWEYACRAGGTFAYCGSDDEDRVALNRAAHRGKTYPVASKQANAFGLYDMSGSVWEWTDDCWHDNYNGAPRDGSAWTTGESCSWSRVVRGGSWSNDPRPATERGIAAMYWDPRGKVNRDPRTIGYGFGFRPARMIP